MMTGEADESKLPTNKKWNKIPYKRVYEPTNHLLLFGRDLHKKPHHANPTLNSYGGT